MTKTYIEVTMVTANSAEALIAGIYSKVSEGWELQGGPAVANMKHSEVEVEPHFAQLLLRHSE